MTEHMPKPEPKTPTQIVAEALTEAETLSANLITFLNGPAPDERKAPHRETLSKIRLDVWTQIEAATATTPPDEFTGLMNRASTLDDRIKGAIGTGRKAAEKAEPTAENPPVTLADLNEFEYDPIGGDQFPALFQAAQIEPGRWDEGRKTLARVLPLFCAQAFTDRKSAPPVLNLMGAGALDFAQALFGGEGVTPSRYKQKNCKGVVAILRGIERAGTVLPKFADHKGRRHSWVVVSEGALPDQVGVQVERLVVGPAVDPAAIKALRAQLWAEAAATPVQGQENDVIGRVC